MNAFLRQTMRDAFSFADSQAMLGQLAAQCK
jgi:flagellum-specific ATP synthase